jgi:hypothetical protein
MTTNDPTWLNFDVHGIVGVRVQASAPTARQLWTMMERFAVDHPVLPDIVVAGDREVMVDAAVIEDELAYNAEGVEFRREQVQVLRHGSTLEVRGSGELLTTVLPLLDLAMVERGAAMIHAATVGYRGGAVALPAAGGTGKTSTIAKLVRRPGFSFMGDDWAFLTAAGRLLNYEKPMFIKPHHKAIYPHLFQGSRKPLVPVRMSRPLGRVTTLVHPHMVRHPRLADFSRRLSPEHRTVSPEQALPGVPVTRDAPLRLAVFVERYEGARTRVSERDTAWMAERMIGNFHLEMSTFSREVLTGLAATSHLSLGAFLAEKARVVAEALSEVPGYVLQVPSVYTPDIASDDIVSVVESLLAEHVVETEREPSGTGVA